MSLVEVHIDIQVFS